MADPPRSAGDVHRFRAFERKAERPGLMLALEVARAGDTLTVWRLDRLGRSLKDLMDLIKTFNPPQCAVCVIYKADTQTDLVPERVLRVAPLATCGVMRLHDSYAACKADGRRRLPVLR